MIATVKLVISTRLKYHTMTRTSSFALLFLISSLAVSFAAAQTCSLRSICYALDESGSIDGNEFAQLQAFTINSARNFDTLSTSAVRTEYSAIAFSDFTSSIIERTEDVEGEFIPAVNGTRSIFGGTNIFIALDACFSVLQQSGGGPRVLVLVTDGQSVGGTDNSDAIKDAGVAIVTVGVGDGIDVPFLEGIATTPDFYIPATFSDLPSISMTVAQNACDAANLALGITPEPTPDFTESPEPTPVSCEEAFDACDFTFGNRSSISVFNVPFTSDVNFTDAITFKSTTLRVGIVSTGSFIPQFIDAIGSAVNITDVGVPPFALTALKTYPLRFPYSVSGVGHQSLQGTQAIDLKDRCIRVFFQSYQILNAGGNVESNVNLQQISPGACTVFRTAV